MDQCIDAHLCSDEANEKLKKVIIKFLDVVGVDGISSLTAEAMTDKIYLHLDGFVLLAAPFADCLIVEHVLKHSWIHCFSMFCVIPPSLSQT